MKKTKICVGDTLYITIPISNSVCDIEIDEDYLRFLFQNTLSGYIQELRSGVKHEEV